MERRDPTDPAETALDVLLRRQTYDPDGELVRFTADGVRLGASQLVDAAGAIAGGLRSTATGLVAGDAVLTCLRPGVPLVEVVYGAAAAGMVEVPLALTTDRAAADRLISRTGARALVVGPAALAANPVLQAVLSDWRDAGRTVLWIDDQPGVASGLDAVPDGLPGRGLALAELAAERPWLLRPGALDPAAPAVVMATSGTTGAAKAALLPHFAGVRQARRVALTMDYGPGDVLLNFFPWNHINVRHAGLLAAIGSGARLVVEPRFSPSGFWARCRAEGITAFHFMGAVIAILIRGVPGPEDRAHAVGRGYGGPAPAEMSARFERRFGVRLLESYASTELGDVTANTTREQRPGSAGRVVPEYELAIRDERGRPVASGVAGPVSVRPRRPDMTFLEYLGDAEATAAVRAADGWLSTGDRGRLDADGYFHYTGRRNDVIRRRGENLSISELQVAIELLPGAAEVVVVGVDSDYTEQDVLLAVEPEPGAVLTDAEAHAWCLRELPRPAWPRYVHVGPLPRTESAKVDIGRVCGRAFRAMASDFDRRCLDERTTIGSDQDADA